MGSHVQVVLRKDVDNVGSNGDIVKVKPGYARNYLIPRGLAMIATRGNIKQVEHHKAIAGKALERLREEAAKAAAEFKTLGALHVAKQVGEEGKLFGSVTSADVAEALARKGKEVDKRKIVMPDEPIRFVGSYEVNLRFAGGLLIPMKLEVKTAS